MYTNISGLTFYRYDAAFYGVCTSKAYTNCEYKHFKNLFMPLNVHVPSSTTRRNTRCNRFTITAYAVRCRRRHSCAVEKSFIYFLLTNPLKSHRGTENVYEWFRRPCLRGVFNEKQISRTNIRTRHHLTLLLYYN